MVFGALLIILDENQPLLTWLEANRVPIVLVERLDLIHLFGLELKILIEFIKLLAVLIEERKVAEGRPQLELMHLVRRLHLVFLSLVVVFLVHGQDDLADEVRRFIDLRFISVRNLRWPVQIDGKLS